MVTARLLMAPTLYFHEGFWMDVGLGSWGEGSDEADSTLACAPFKQNPPRPPHTPLLSQQCPYQLFQPEGSQSTRWKDKI